MALHITLDEDGTHAIVRAVADDAKASSRTQMLRPGESYRGIPYARWEQHRGCRVDVPGLRVSVPVQEPPADPEGWPAPDAPAPQVYPLPPEGLRWILGIGAASLAVVVATVFRIQMEWGFAALTLAAALLLMPLNRSGMRLLAFCIFALVVQIANDIIYGDLELSSPQFAQSVALMMLCITMAQLTFHFLAVRRMENEHGPDSGPAVER